MKNDVQEMRRRVQIMEQELSSAHTQLKNYVDNCRHQYTPPVYDPIRHEAYTIPRDEPGTMGVDWRGPIHVDAKIEERWRRECKLCGEVEYTNKSHPIVERHEPDFGDVK